MSADKAGLEMMDAAGYDLGEAPRLFRMTVDYLAEVQAQTPASPLPFAFSTTSHMKPRIAAYEKLLASDYAEAATDTTRKRNEAVFDEMVYAVRVHQAGLELDRGRFDSAARTAAMALETRADDPDLWVIVGEARLRSKSRADRAGAIEAWESAIALDRNHPGANRALGLLYYRDFERSGESRDKARAHLARYLRVRPDAPDAGHVSHYLERLQNREAAAR
jgi:tetratricopeptide (TPR) repeat protein